jgi:5-formyltetrahydrofolate cyclo-ligase
MVAAYRSVGVEPPTMPLLAFLHERRLETVVPWARDPREAAGKWRDRWVSWPPDEAIRERPESRTPAGDTAPSEVLRRVGCAIVPALAVARDGTRLGQGGGWYDRALQLVTPGVAVLAMVNPAEVLPAGEVPRERHDIPVAGAVLPGGIVWFDDRVAVAVSRQPRAE